MGIKCEAADGINGGLAEDDVWQRAGRNGEEAEVFLAAGRQTPPTTVSGSTQFSTDGEVMVSQKQENDIGPGVGIEG